MTQLALELDGLADPAQRSRDIAVIHRATGIYTVPPEIEALLDELGWPARGRRLLDPGAGNGGFLVAALTRLPLVRDDIAAAAHRVHGYEFYPGAVAEARQAIAAHLAGRGWSATAAAAASRQIVEERDFLLSPVPAGVYDVIAANPPYWRLTRLPPGYRAEYELMVPRHARADLLHAYLSRAAEILMPGGWIGLVTADRWLLNSQAAELRARLGRKFRVTGLRRLDAASAFYVPKDRREGRPPRVHPVALVLQPGRHGRQLGRAAFHLEDVPEVDGVPLRDLVSIRLAPWIGPEGLFLVTDPGPLRAAGGRLVPAVKPGDITGTVLGPARRWVLVTGEERPPDAILAHLRRGLDPLPATWRGRRATWWLPPETFADRLPLAEDAVLVPEIAPYLKGVVLPAGVLPVDHQLTVLHGRPAAQILAMLAAPEVQAQARALARRLENGYQRFPPMLLRDLVVPRHLSDRS